MTKPCDCSVTVVLYTSDHILYGLPLYQKGNVSKISQMVTYLVCD